MRRCDESDASGLVECVFQLGHAIGWVDVDEDQPGLCRSELGDDPFGVVWRPDADPVTAFEPEGQQTSSEGVHSLLQLAVGPANLLVPNNQRVAVTKTLDDPVEMDTDCIANKGRIACTVDITQLGHFRCPFQAARRPFRTPPAKSPVACPFSTATVPLTIVAAMPSAFCTSRRAPPGRSCSTVGSCGLMRVSSKMTRSAE